MTVSWINLSTRWSITSVQAALNLIFSVLGTIAIWSLSRFWWQHSGKKVLKHDSTKAEVPLPDMLSLSSPGEAYDAMVLLGMKLFSRSHLTLLLQLLVICLITSACIFAGPLAKVSVRTTQILRLRDLDVLQAWKAGGRAGNSLNDNVKWNHTMESLNRAGFPHDQLLNYLPPWDIPWTYVASEWDPVWRADCQFHEEVLLDHLTATGEATFIDALDAFPKYKDTYDTAWLNASEIRRQIHFSGETDSSNNKTRVKDIFIWILLQSDPSIDNRLRTNRGSMNISISALHIKGIDILTGDDNTQGGVTEWRPSGVATNASYTRVSCGITQKPGVTASDTLPWLWSNDTYSLTQGYRANWFVTLSDLANRNATVVPPTAREMFRFYQAYKISENTRQTLPGGPVTQRLSVWTTTVQLSTTYLAFLMLLALLALWLTGRYVLFLRRYRRELRETCVPDGKIE